MIKTNDFTIKSILDIKNDTSHYNTEICFNVRKEKLFLTDLMTVRLIIYGNYLQNLNDLTIYELYINNEFITLSSNTSLINFINDFKSANKDIDKDVIKYLEWFANNSFEYKIVQNYYSFKNNLV